ncbi:MAG: nucleotide exchange factor GrpE [Verrucomicrobiota bacterium]
MEKNAESKVDKAQVDEATDANSTGTASGGQADAGMTLTAAQIAELQSKAAKADDHWDRLVRIAADLDNYKKRAAREKQEAIKFANESILQKLIPVLDNFDMAVTATQNSHDAAVQSLQSGVLMILQQFKAALNDAGLEEIDASGKAFDPNLHEAVSQQETESVPDGHVVQQLRKGYKLKDRLLRPATVIVARTPSTQHA